MDSNYDEGPVFVIIKSGPGTPGATRGVELAREAAADIVLRGEGTELAAPEALRDFCGTVYVLGDDIPPEGTLTLAKGVKALSPGELEELLDTGSVLDTF